jgi:hypothetical protein
MKLEMLVRDNSSDGKSIVLAPRNLEVIAQTAAGKIQPKANPVVVRKAMSQSVDSATPIAKPNTIISRSVGCLGRVNCL